MLQIDLQGGFGEKGRTSIAVQHGRTRLMFDAGIKVGASGDEYYPMLARPAAEVDALFISHAHEDHVGALCRMIRLGYRGPVYMTAETRHEMPATLAQYADRDDLRAFPPPAEQIRIFTPGEQIEIGGLAVSTGASGHVAGGVWFGVEAGGRRLVYAADMVPGSGVFHMAPLPSCDGLILDCSYGGDVVSAPERATDIAQWVAAHSTGCLLPTPLSGRSLELMAALEAPFAIEAGMRDRLREQIDAPGALHAHAFEQLHRKLAAAIDWGASEPLPACPLIVHDGMGVAGPSRIAIPAADAMDYPILLTGHLPEGSPAAVLAEKGRADWVRMPTHPTLPENVELWEKAGRPVVLGHSCGPAMLDEMKAAIPALQADLRTGHTYGLE